MVKQVHVEPHTLILCPHMEHDEHGRIKRETAIHPLLIINLDPDHSLCLCPFCGEIVKANILSRLMQTAIQSGVNDSLRKKW